MCENGTMKRLLTAKLKLLPTPEQHASLRRTQLAYRDALNYVSRHAFAAGKLSHGRRLQRETYAEIRARFGLPAQMPCNLPRPVGATYTNLWTRAKANAEARAQGATKKRYKGLDHPPTYGSPTLTYNHGRDYGPKTGSRLSLLTLDGRVVVPYQGYDQHTRLLQAGARLGAAKLWYDQRRKRFSLLVALEIEIADPTPEQLTTVAGVDVGQRYLAVTTTTANHTGFHSGQASRQRADHFARLRTRLQRKGTRSATRALRRIGQRERRFLLDRNHALARRIVDAHPRTLLGLEDLRDIRERSPRRHGKKATPRRQRANRHAARWPFAQFQELLAAKAARAGSLAVWVDAHYTSQACPRCGHTSKANRPGAGLLFVCQGCAFQAHADLVGARNIAHRTLLIRQDWVSTGVLSVRPDVSDQEAKAARLSRYSESRWSPETSPPASAVGN